MLNVTIAATHLGLKPENVPSAECWLGSIISLDDGNKNLYNKS